MDKRQKPISRKLFDVKYFFRDNFLYNKTALFQCFVKEGNIRVKLTNNVCLDSDKKTPREEGAKNDRDRGQCESCTRLDGGVGGVGEGMGTK